MQNQLSELQAMVKELCRRSDAPRHGLPEELFRLFTDLLDSDLSEELARELVERVRTETKGSHVDDLLMVKARMARMIEAEVRVSGPIQVTPGRCRLVALVGPTGVGKTTTIAKLAANYRLKEKRRVGLITVDTYRIAAVEQLRTYADIIDLPMQVVSTPREMREAVGRMDNLDLILLDTAGRSPKDEVRIQELRAFLTEADADEVHLVLEQRGQRPRAGADGRALRRRRHHVADPDQARRGDRPGQHPAAGPLQQAAVELPDQRPERAGRHRSGRVDARGKVDSGNGGASRTQANCSCDQATDLRALVRQVATQHCACGDPAAADRGFRRQGGRGHDDHRGEPGGGPGAAGRATACSCDAAGGDVALQCRLEPRHTLADVLAGKRTLAQVLHAGPGRRADPARHAGIGPLARDGGTCLEPIDGAIADACRPGPRWWSSTPAAGPIPWPGSSGRRPTACCW